MMSDTFDFGKEIVWRPSPDYSNAHLTRFMRQHGTTRSKLMQRQPMMSWFTGCLAIS
jgi:hypothetical protein